MIEELTEFKHGTKIDETRRVWACDCQSVANAGACGGREGGFWQVEITIEGTCKLCAHYAIRVDKQVVDEYAQKSALRRAESKGRKCKLKKK